jgi:hypothetical protein
MTVYLHCEGITDYAVIPVLMKKASNMPNMDIRNLNDKVKEFKTHRKKPNELLGYKLIKNFATFYSQNDSKYIAYHQDADGKYSDVYNAIISNFEPLKEKDFRCLAIVPKEMIESWLLADVTAINALGDGTIHVNQSPDPESFNNPKEYLKRNLEELGVKTDEHNIPIAFAQIAKNINNIEVLKNRCKVSFGQFYTDMQTFIAEEHAS